MSFTVIIDSNNRLSGNTNDCQIKINCPISNEHLECEILLFSIAYPVDLNPLESFVKLVVNNLNIYNQYSNATRDLLTIYDNRNYRFSRTSFYCENFNNLELNFRLVNENNVLIKDPNNNENQFNLPWIIIIKCTP